MRHYFDDVVVELPPPARDLLRPSYHAQLTTNRTPDARPLAGERRGSVAAGGAGARLPQPGRRRGPVSTPLVSVERLRRRGATIDVRMLPGFDHVNSWIQAMPRAVR